LRKRGGGSLALLIASFALLLAFENVTRIVWGSNTLFFGYLLTEVYQIGSVRFTSAQLLAIGVSASMMFLLHFLLSKTKIGKAMRAVSENQSLAEACGIEVGRITLFVWLITGIYAGIAGSFVGIDSQLYPRMGIDLMLPIFAAAVVGGIGNPYGAMLGAALIGFSTNFGIAINFGAPFGVSLYIPTLYKYAISFVIMILVLIVRPTGILKGRVGD
jgi:branched-subunit amino acid ABC-type transport system permease component